MDTMLPVDDLSWDGDGGSLVPSLNISVWCGVGTGEYVCTGEGVCTDDK